MPEELKIIWILAVGLGFACIAGYLAQCIKLSPITGYLVAGYLIGPNSPGFIVDQQISDQLATIGVTLLMFAVGLNFNWKDISGIKHIVITGGIVLSFLSICAGILLSVYLGETLIAGSVIGVAICVSSTVVIVRLLADQNLLQSRQGHIVLGWTIIEDVISVLGLILLPALVHSAASDGSPLATISYAVMLVLAKIIILGLLIYFIGIRLIEYILKVIARTRSHELFTLAILACVFTLAVGSSYIFGISIALGAFIAGAVVGRTELSHQAAANALPMRDAFAVIFFLSVGMLFNPMVVAQNLPLFIGILVILLLIRPLFAFLILKIAKYPSYIGLTVAIAISQIGEYSFILAEEGSNLKILPDTGYDILVACAFITIALNPIFFQLFSRFTQVPVPEKNTLDSKGNIFYQPRSSPQSFLPRAVVVGYGAVGKSIGNFLKNRYEVLFIDRNIDLVSKMRERHLDMVYGDASQVQLLEQTKLENAQLIVITIPDVELTRAIIEAAQHINPDADIIVRVQYKSDRKTNRFGTIPVICDEEAAAEKMIAEIKHRYKH